MIIATVLYAAMQTIITLLFSGALWIAEKILNASITTFSEGDNIIQNFINLLPFPETLNVSGIVFGIADALLILIFITSLIKSYSAVFMGENQPNAAQVALRCSITLLLSKLIFGSNVFGFNGLLSYVGEWFGTILSNVSPSITYSSFQGVSFGVDLDVATYIGQLVLAGALMASVVGAAITYLERILSFAVSIIFGPIFITLYANNNTADTAKQWIIGVFTQFGAILLSLILWVLFLNKVSAFPTVITDSGTYIFDLAVAIVLLNLMKNSEKIFNAIGLKTMPNTDSARSVMAGLGALGAGLMLTRTASTLIGRGHSSRAVVGGTRETGRSNLFENGNLSNNASGNTASKAWQYSKSWNPFMGSNSTLGVSDKQNDAINSINAAMGNAEVGQQLEGITSGSVNEAIRGSSTGVGFNFESKNIIKASTNEANGLVGDAVYINANGDVDALGKYFMPVDNYSPSEMVVGATVDMADGNNWVLTGESQIIDGAGNRAYQIKSPDPIISDDTSSQTIDFKTIQANASDYKNIFTTEPLPQKQVKNESIYAPSDDIAKEFKKQNKG